MSRFFYILAIGSALALSGCQGMQPVAGTVTQQESVAALEDDAGLRSVFWPSLLEENT